MQKNRRHVQRCLAYRQIQAINDLARLQQAILKVGLSKDAAEVANALTALSAEMEKEKKRVRQQRLVS